MRDRRENVLPVPLIADWKTATAILIRVLEDGTDRGKEQARAELMEMAGKLDHLSSIVEHIDIGGAA